MVLRANVERVDLILFLAALLKHDEGGSKDYEHGEHAQVQLVANAYGERFYGHILSEE